MLNLDDVAPADGSARGGCAAQHAPRPERLKRCEGEQLEREHLDRGNTLEGVRENNLRGNNFKGINGIGDFYLHYIASVDGSARGGRAPQHDPRAVARGPQLPVYRIPVQLHAILLKPRF